MYMYRYEKRVKYYGHIETNTNQDDDDDDHHHERREC